MSESWKYGVYYDLYTFLSLLNFSKLKEVYENRNMFMTKCKVEKKQITQWSLALLTPSTASQRVQLGGWKHSGSTSLRAPSHAPAHPKHSSFRFHLKSFLFLTALIVMATDAVGPHQLLFLLASWPNVWPTLINQSFITHLAKSSPQSSRFCLSQPLMYPLGSPQLSSSPSAHAQEMCSVHQASRKLRMHNELASSLFSRLDGQGPPLNGYSSLPGQMHCFLFWKQREKLKEVRHCDPASDVTPLCGKERNQLFTLSPLWPAGLWSSKTNQVGN